MGQFKIELKTGSRFWTPKGLGAMGMDPHRAIAELVANSLDWRRDRTDGVEPIIEVFIGKGFIEIRDNGVGMTSNELQDAVQVSVANDTRRKNLRIRKGMFGMGMKVACLTLGWKITIHTRSISEKNKEHILILNTRLLDNEEASKKYRDNIKGNTDKWVLDGPLKDWKSGTSILLEDLTNRSLNPITVRDSLQEIFNPEIGVEQIKIVIIDATKRDKEKKLVCEKVEVPIFEKTKINLDELNLQVTSDETGKKENIRGWIALMKTGSPGAGNWGLHLFKNNQIIERFHQLPSRLGGLMPRNPHTMFARTYGEIHLDMCKPAFHKVGFDYSTNSWHRVQKLLEPHINAIMTASQEYRAKDYEKAEQSIKSIQKHRKATKKTIKKFKKKSELIEIDKPADALILPDGQWFTIVEPIFDNIGDANQKKPWIYHYREESRELAIIINKGSPIYLRILEDKLNENLLEIVVKWSISDCILLLLYEKFDLSLEDSLRFRDEQLSTLFNNQIEE